MTTARLKSVFLKPVHHLNLVFFGGGKTPYKTWSVGVVVPRMLVSFDSAASLLS